MDLEKLVVSLTADISKFKSGMSEAENITGSTSSNIGANFASAGKAMTKWGALGTATITAPIVAFGMSAVKMASDLEESLNKVNVIFGDSADEIQAWADTSTTALGMSKSEALEAAGNFGNLFNSIGLGIDENSKMSKSVIQLGADLGSFNNMSTDESLAKLQAGLIGSYEPLRSMEIFLSEATVKQKAMEMGLADANGEFDAGALVQARYALILDQTKVVQGDFARTSDGLANSTKIAHAELADLSASLGAELLPMITDLLRGLIPIVQNFNEMDPAGKKTTTVILAIAAVIPPLIMIFGSLATGVTSIIALFGTGGGLAGVGTFLSATVFPALSAVIAAVGLPIILLIAAVGLLIAVWKKFGAQAIESARMLDEIVKIKLQQFGTWLSNVFTSAWSGVKSAIDSVIDSAQKLWDKLTRIKLPSWLTPGSPTPFELGLRGIGDAMKSLNKSVLPEFSSQMNITGTGTVTVPTSTNDNEIVRLLREIAAKPSIDERYFASLLSAEMTKAIA